MSDRSLWNWTIIGTAVLAVVGVVVARVLQALLPSDTLNIVVAVFFSLCVIVMGSLVAYFMLQRRR